MHHCFSASVLSLHVRELELELDLIPKNESEDCMVVIPEMLGVCLSLNLFACMFMYDRQRRQKDTCTCMKNEHSF